MTDPIPSPRSPEDEPPIPEGWPIVDGKPFNPEVEWVPSPRSPQPDPLTPKILDALPQMRLDLDAERYDAYRPEDVRRLLDIIDRLDRALRAATPIPSPDTDLRTVVEHSSPYRNCQYATAQRAPCPDVNPRVPASWCAFCQAHARLAAASSESTHGPWCVQDGHGDSAAPFVHGPSCRRSSAPPETLDAAPERPTLDVERLHYALEAVDPVSFGRAGTVALSREDIDHFLYAKAVAAEYEDEPIANCPECEAPVGAGMGCVHWPGTLDAAWTAVVAALPDDWSLWWVQNDKHIDGGWDACAGWDGAKNPADARTASGQGDTPAAALRALAARLTDSREQTAAPVEGMRE